MGVTKLCFFLQKLSYVVNHDIICMLEKLTAFNNVYWDTPRKQHNSQLITQRPVSHADAIIAPPFLFIESMFLPLIKLPSIFMHI